MASLRERLRATARLALDSALGASPEPPPAAAPPTRRDVQDALNDALAQHEANAFRLDSFENAKTGMGFSGQSAEANTVVSINLPRLSRRRIATIVEHEGYAVDYMDKLQRGTAAQGWFLQTGSNKHVDAFANEDRRLRLSERVGEAFRHGKEYGACLVLMVTDDGRPLDQPLDMSRVTKIHALHVLTDEEFSPWDYVGDGTDVHWREVRTWDVTAYNPNLVSLDEATDVEDDDDARRLARARVSLPAFRVHRSRVLHFRGKHINSRERALNGGKDRTIFQPLVRGLQDLDTTNRAGATAATELQTKTLKVAGLSTMAAGSQWTTILTRMKAFAMGRAAFKMGIIGDGDEVVTSNANASGYNTLKEGAEGTWAAQTGQSRRQAFGEAGGNLSSGGENERDQWDRKLKGLQQADMRPPLEQYYGVQQAIAVNTNGGNLGGPGFDPDTDPEDLEHATVGFGDLVTYTRKQEADIYRHIAEGDMMYIRERGLTPEEVRRYRFGPEGYNSGGFVVDPEPKTTDGDISSTVMSAVSIIAAADPEAGANIALSLLKGETPDFPSRITVPEPVVPPVAPGGATDGRANAQAGKRRAGGDTGVKTGDGS